jgi:transcriptional regulator with XRE-family HTH domain
MDLFEYVGKRIRDLRGSYGAGVGLSQEALAKTLGSTANTISRWETGIYRPSIEDLDKLARVFNISILEFFPPNENNMTEPLSALLRAAKELPDEDLEELRKYAEFRRARYLLEVERPKPGRKGKGKTNS